VNTPLAIEIVVGPHPRAWQALIVSRLRAAGHQVSVSVTATERPWSPVVVGILALERLVFRRQSSLAAPAERLEHATVSLPVALRLDLTGSAGAGEVPCLTLAFDGSATALAAASTLAAGRLPELELRLDGGLVASAAPMVDKRFLVSAGLDDVLARAVTLTLSTVARFAAGTLGATIPRPPAAGRTPSFIGPYLTSALPRLLRETLRRTRFQFAHWRVGYRFIDGPGAERGRLGDGWIVLPDDGQRFFADPFPFIWQNRSFIFVEDYAHAAGKATISVVEIAPDGHASMPREVLAEPYHLSYPQVFARDGAIWMLPEGSGGGELVLYRAEQFPDHWVRDTILFSGRQLSDATLLEHDGRLWLFATDRDGHGSTSDTLVVFFATDLRGPWVAHPMNPITIDRAAARPGGSFVRSGNTVLLPVQDGRLGYGGGLGLAELLELTTSAVRMAPPVPIAAAGDWPYPQIHTLNRAGRLEVIDGIVAMPKGPR